MIVSSFAQQYGIRLHNEYESISLTEYRQLLTGLNGDTSLGYAVRIRSEKDPKKIKEMTNHEKKIRSDWLEFKNKNKPKENAAIYVSKENINTVFSKIFG